MNETLFVEKKLTMEEYVKKAYDALSEGNIIEMQSKPLRHSYFWNRGERRRIEPLKREAPPWKMMEKSLQIMYAIHACRCSKSKDFWKFVEKTGNKKSDIEKYVIKGLFDMTYNPYAGLRFILNQCCGNWEPSTNGTVYHVSYWLNKCEQERLNQLKAAEIALGLKMEIYKKTP